MEFNLIKQQRQSQIQILETQRAFPWSDDFTISPPIGNEISVKF